MITANEESSHINIRYQTSVSDCANAEMLLNAAICCLIKGEDTQRITSKSIYSDVQFKIGLNKCFYEGIVHTPAISNRHIDVVVCRGKYTIGIVILVIIYSTYNT